MVTYDLITPENKEKLTPELIEELIITNYKSKLNKISKEEHDILKERYISFFKSKDFKLFIAYENKKMVGILYGHILSNEFYLNGFYVNKKQLVRKNSKIGTKLMIRALSHLIYKEKVTMIDPGYVVDNRVYGIIEKMFERIKRNPEFKKYVLEPIIHNTETIRYKTKFGIKTIFGNSIKIKRK